jgi:hypothetical protein
MGEKAEITTSRKPNDIIFSIFNEHIDLITQHKMGFIDELILLVRLKANITLTRSQVTYYIRQYRTTNQIEKTYLTTPEYREKCRIRYQLNQLKKQAQTPQATTPQTTEQDTIAPQAADVKPHITFELSSPQTAMTE